MPRAGFCPIIDPDFDGVSYDDLLEACQRGQSIVGRLDVLQVPPPQYEYDQRGTWEFMEMHCAKADRSRSVWFRDEDILRRRREREEIARVARKARAVTAKKLREAKERN